MAYSRKVDYKGVTIEITEHRCYLICPISGQNKGFKGNRMLEDAKIYVDLCFAGQIKYFGKKR